MTLTNHNIELSTHVIKRLNFRDKKERIINIPSLNFQYAFKARTHFIKGTGPIQCNDGYCCTLFGSPQYFTILPVIEYKNYEEKIPAAAFWGYMALSFKSEENLKDLFSSNINNLPKYDLKVTEKEIASKGYKVLEFKEIGASKLLESEELKAKAIQFLKIYQEKINYSTGRNISDEGELNRLSGKIVETTPEENPDGIDFDEIPFN